MGVNDGLGKRGGRKSKQGEVRRNETEGGQQEREMKRTRQILSFTVVFISVSLQCTLFLSP